MIETESVRKFLYWFFNIISPNINAQALITYILAQKSTFCQRYANESSGVPGSDIWKSIGDDTIGWNITLLILHIILLLILLIVIDSGLLQSRFSYFQQSNFDENTLDNDVLTERHRILNSTETTTSELEERQDYLTVNNLVKYYPKKDVLAVNHLTFGAKRGEAFGLLGYNVSYKTSLLNFLYQISFLK